MKPIAILILGCVPLAALTVWSFVELASVEHDLAGPGTAEDLQARAETAEQFRAQVRADQQPLTELAKADLLAGRPLEGLAKAPDASRLKRLEQPWPQWVEALRTSEALIDADRPTAIGDVEALEKATSQMEELKARIEGSSLQGTDPVLKVVRGRIDRLETRIARIEQEGEAGSRIGRARAAFHATEYAQCVKLCDELLSKYAEVIDATAAENVRILRQRAQFWDDAGRLFSDLETAGTMPKRRTVLQGFVDKYPDRHVHMDSERKILDQCRRDLTDTVQKIESAEKDRAATESIERLRADLPAAFSDRLKRAGEIADRYGTETCRATLRGEICRWLAEFLPEKKIEESPRLQEVETAQHQIVRGYFTQVNSPRGYKRYPTHEQSIRPVSEVGTYLANQLLGAPGATIPRRCVARYNTARAAVMDSPRLKRAWRELAELCDRLDKELEAYRQKPGSSKEKLSFGSEARFARDRLNSADWEHLEKLWTTPSGP